MVTTNQPWFCCTDYMVFVLKLLLYKLYLICPKIWLLHFYYYITVVNFHKGIIYDARFEK